MVSAQHAIARAKMIKYQSTIMISHQFHAIQRNLPLDIIDISHNRDSPGPWDGNTHGDGLTGMVGQREIAGIRSMSLRLMARPGCFVLPPDSV